MLFKGQLYSFWLDVLLYLLYIVLLLKKGGKNGNLSLQQIQRKLLFLVSPMITLLPIPRPVGFGRGFQSLDQCFSGHGKTYFLNKTLCTHGLLIAPGLVS